MSEENPGAKAALPLGPGAAAMLAAGVGCCALGVLAVATDHVPWLRGKMIFYRPTGPLSGVTTCAVLVWLLVWVFLEWRWGRRDVGLRPIATLALVLLGIGLLLTFPPVSDLF